MEGANGARRCRLGDAGTRLPAGDARRGPAASSDLRTIGFRFAEVEEGHIVMEMNPGEHLYNPIGTVHGGVMVTLLDSVAGSAVHSALPVGFGYTTVSLNTSFLRPVRSDTGLLRAEGRLLKPGRRMALSEATLTDVEGRLHAHATANSMILEI